MLGLRLSIPCVAIRAISSLESQIAALFSAGEQGAWYEPSDFSTMFQDAAGTIPVTTVGQAVGLILDKSGRGNHATQTTDTKRPVLQQEASGPYYLLFDGIDDALQTASVNFTGTDKVTVFAGLSKFNQNITSALAELSKNINFNNGAFFIGAPTSTNSYQFNSKGTSEALAPVPASKYPSPSKNVITCLGDISGDSLSMRVNGIQEAISTADQGTGNYGNYPLYIGSRGGTTFPFNGRLYSLIVRGAQSTATQISTAETYVNSKTGAY